MFLLNVCGLGSNLSSIGEVCVRGLGTDTCS